MWTVRIIKPKLLLKWFDQIRQLRTCYYQNYSTCIIKFYLLNKCVFYVNFYYPPSLIQNKSWNMIRASYEK